MVELANSVLYVGTPGNHNSPRERALIIGGIDVALIHEPESAVSFVRNTNVKVVLIDDTLFEQDLSQFAGSLKVARPSLRIIAMVNAGRPTYVDTVLEKPFSGEALLKAVKRSLS